MWTNHTELHRFLFIGDRWPGFAALHLFNNYITSKINNRIRNRKKKLTKPEQIRELTIGAVCCVRIASKLLSSVPIRSKGTRAVFGNREYTAIGSQLLQPEINVLQAIDYEINCTTAYDMLHFLIATFRPKQTATEVDRLTDICNTLLELTIFGSCYWRVYQLTFVNPIRTPGVCAAGVIVAAIYLSPSDEDLDAVTKAIVDLTGYSASGIESCALELIEYLKEHIKPE
eukprot:CFRG0251T1